VPGLMEAALLLLTTAWLTRRHGYGATTGRPDVAGFARRLPRAAGALSMPVLVLGSIYLGIFTPTEVSAVAAGYAALLCVIVYRTMTWRRVWQVSQESILQSTMIFMVVMGGSLVGFILARMGVSASLVSVMERMQISAWSSCCWPISCCWRSACSWTAWQ